MRNLRPMWDGTLSNPSAGDARALVAGAIEAGWGGIVWTGEPGSGASTALERTVADLSRGGGPRWCVVRVPAHAAVPHARPAGAIVAALARLGASCGDGHGRAMAPEDPPAALDALRRSFCDAVTAHSGGDRVLIVADDLDALDDTERRVLLGAAAGCPVPVVVLATAHGAIGDDAAAALKELRMPRLGPRDALGVLREHAGVPVAPHVAATLCAGVRGNVGALVELAGALRPQQLAGTRALPDPLPATETIRRCTRGRIADLDERERRALLIASVCIVDRTDVFLAASGLDMQEVLDGGLAGLLGLVAGRFAVSDPRVRSLTHHEATLAERTEAHAALDRAAARVGDRRTAAWHHCLARLDGDQEQSTAVLAAAECALADGDAVWAHAAAREAAAHLPAGRLPRAWLLAGRAALAAGHVADAVDWLRRVVLGPSGALAATALAPCVLAETLADGAVSVIELDRMRHRLRLVADQGWRGVAELPRSVVSGVVTACATAAGLYAERGDLRRAEQELRTARILAGLGRCAGAVVAVCADWCAAFGLVDADADAQRAVARGPLAFAAELAAGLRAASRGRLAEAERRLGRARVLLDRGRSAWNPDAGSEAAQRGGGPLASAHLAVASALARIAAGRFALAADGLRAAARALPVALPFGGLGVAALCRAALMADGRPGALCRALDENTDAGSSRRRKDRRVDAAIRHAFAGEDDRALALLDLADEDDEEHGTGWSVADLLPEPDRVDLCLSAGDAEAATRMLTAARTRVERAEAATGRAHPSLRAARLRAELAVASADEAIRMRAQVEELARTLVSVTDRALTELALAQALTRAGEGALARGHHAAAVELFLQSGATALTRYARNRGEHPGRPAPVGAPAWSIPLTEREAQVAALVVRGASNQQVAAELAVSVRTVEVHLGKVFKKLGVRSRTELSYLTRAGAGGRAVSPAAPQ